jgi:hypothetical protein
LYVAKNNYVDGSSSKQQATSVGQLDIHYLTREPFGLCSCPLVAETKIKTNDGDKYKNLISELLKYNACNAIGINKHQWKSVHRYEHSSIFVLTQLTYQHRLPNMVFVRHLCININAI